MPIPDDSDLRRLRRQLVERGLLFEQEQVDLDGDGQEAVEVRVRRGQQPGFEVVFVFDTAGNFRDVGAFDVTS